MRERLFTGSAIVLLVIASAVLYLNWEQVRALNLPLALTLLVFALFCINSGFSLPDQGYVSFDRVAQVSSILVLGPVPAAAINGLASLIFPLRRLLKGEPLRKVLDSSVANAGMMTLVIFISGSVYQTAGGEVPVQHVAAGNVMALLLMAVSLHGLNELCMVWFVYLRSGRVGQSINGFGYSVEMFGVLMGILVAAVLPALQAIEFALLMMVMAAGMMILKQLAELRQSLSEKVAQRTQELEEKTAALNDLARRDSLTELLNRRAMDEWLVQACAGPAAPQVSVALLDVDHFKSINDQHSHALGDAVLGEVGRLISETLQDEDAAARFGGDEFLLAFKATDRDQLKRRCEALLNKLRSLQWDSSSQTLGQPLQVTASMGLAIGRCEPNPARLIARADQQLYRAKHAGRDQLSIEQPES